MRNLSKSAFNVLVTLIVLAVLSLWLVGNYNSLVSSQVAVAKSWASVEVQYQKRFDLTDNLVQTVKAGQKQELEVFTAIANARKQYNSSSSLNDKTAAANSIETNLALIPKLQEAYPELKSNSLVQSLLVDLKTTEDSVAKARDTFNTTAANYNTNVRRFPKNIFANMFGFEKVELFAGVKEAAKAVKVNF